VPVSLDIIFNLPTEPFSEDQLTDIADSLGVQSLSDKHVSDLQHAGWLYLLFHHSDPRTAGEDRLTIHPTRKQQAAAFRRVKYAARKLATDPDNNELRQKMDQALERPGLIFTDLYGRDRKLDLTNPVDLELLAQIAEEADEQLLTTGRDPKIARYKFFCELVPIYESILGKLPGRSVNWKSHVEAGSFKRFACAALESLNPDAVKTVDWDLRRAVKAQKSSQ
jgi:hypothetical protein